MKQIALSGIKPTGTLHIGNYLGMIKPAFDLIENFKTLYFVADYHALTTLKDKGTLNQYVYDVAATLLALGLAYSEIKQELYELLNEFFGGRRDTYHQLRGDKNHLDHILNQGSEKARAIAGPVFESVRRAIGISR